MPIITCPIHQAFKERPQNPALIIGKTILSYEKLEYDIQEIHAALLKKGVKQGYRVALISEEKDLLIKLLFSLQRIGASSFIINPNTPQESITKLIKISNVNTIINLSTAYHPIQTKSLSIISYKDLCSTEKVTNPFISTDQITTLLMTSGSSGKPKIAVHTIGNHYYNALGSNQVLPLSEQSSWLLSLPLFHVSGIAILFRCFLKKACITIPQQNETLRDIIMTYPFTHLSCVNTQLIKILNNKTLIERIKQCELILLGGAPCSKYIIKKAQEFKLQLSYTYGLTEMSSQVTTSTIKKTTNTTLSSTGNILPYREILIDKNNEILVKGPTLFKGYLNDNLIQLDLTQQGWFKTGDLGEIDKKGELLIVGRKDNMFISGGENIQPEEIEAIITNSHTVNQCIVIPIEHPDYGFRPVAIIDFDSKKINLKELKETLKNKLLPFKIPDYFIPWPKNEKSTLKNNRQSLRYFAQKYIKKNSIQC